MSHEHKATGCQRCNDEAHEKAEKGREKEQRKASVRPIGLVVAATLAMAAVIGLWVAVVTLLSYLAG
ncbi:hypothetical protein [Streptomyces sp. YGL11-2]|uniref:hypothetical protein n=1 Tax=Streptomyces sp. YGL11-2 TaxID=3414028 RepID=UPI003CEF1075